MPAEIEISRRAFLRGASAPVAFQPFASRAASLPAAQPNVILILADDLGYGDLGCYGSRRTYTPILDTVARDGMRFTDFHAGASVCTPSRCALLTGRYPHRTGVKGLTDVILRKSDAGLPEGAVTLAHCLGSAGYQTACIGKWHLGHNNVAFFPTLRGGFGQFFGTPASANMWPLLIYRGTETVADFSGATERLMPAFANEALRFISETSDRPFFLYLALTSPHVPYTPSRRFSHSTKGGAYGDCVAEVDWIVGQVLSAVDRNGLAERTLVLFTSDNGPEDFGSTGRFRGRKIETYEGGHRVPFLAHWPGVIPPGRTCAGLASAMDILPTIARLCGANLPNALDGVDIWPLLSEAAGQVPRELLLHFNGLYPECARIQAGDQNWKLRRWIWGCYLEPPWLYDLCSDPPDEEYDAAADNPEIVSFILDRMNASLATFPPEMVAAP